MKLIFTIIILISVQTSILFAQKEDVITGETLTAEDLHNYLTNPSIRAKYNNDPYDNNREEKLKGKMPYVSGEILNPGQAYVDKLMKRSVTVKEFLPSGKGGDAKFMGAFQYSGYSLSDIVKDYVISKINSEEFGLPLDMYVIVENDKGESAVFSWGELFFSGSQHDIILATHVQPVFPTHDDDQRWSSPQKIRLVAANDYLTVRNIEQPSKIILRSFPKSFPGHKGLKPIYAPELQIFGIDGKEVIIKDQDIINEKEIEYNTVFFGLHKGIKGGRSFKGIPFADVLNHCFSFSDEDLQHGLIGIAAKDAYRVVFSLSELLNRTDMAETLMIDSGENEDGRFIIRPGSDFFADRHLKGAKIGYIITAE